MWKVLSFSLFVLVSTRSVSLNNEFIYGFGFMPRFAANLSTMFNECSFLDRFKAAAHAGFCGVEYLFPYDFNPADIKARLDEHGLKQVLFNMPAGNWAAGDRGLACIPARINEFKETVEQSIEYAKVLDCEQIHCMMGVAPKGVDKDILLQVVLDNLKYAADKFKHENIKLLIEPINTRDIPGYYLSHTIDALNLISEVDAHNISLQYDIYHMQVMEGDLAMTIKENLASIAHIQIADTPGRYEPGTGEINYAYLFSFLDDVGYQGWVGAEYFPSTTTQDSLKWFEPYR